MIAIFAGRLLDGRRPTIFGDGRQTRDYTYVGDIVAANLATAAHPEAHGEYNVGTGVESSVLEVLAALREAGGAEAAGWEPEFAPPRTGEIDRSFLDVGRARAELGFTSADHAGRRHAPHRRGAARGALAAGLERAGVRPARASARGRGRRHGAGRARPRCAGRAAGARSARGRARSRRRWGAARRPGGAARGRRARSVRTRCRRPATRSSPTSTAVPSRVSQSSAKAPMARGRRAAADPDARAARRRSRSSPRRLGLRAAAPRRPRAEAGGGRGRRRDRRAGVLGRDLDAAARRSSSRCAARRPRPCAARCRPARATRWPSRRAAARGSSPGRRVRGLLGAAAARAADEGEERREQGGYHEQAGDLRAALRALGAGVALGDGLRGLRAGLRDLQRGVDLQGGLQGLQRSLGPALASAAGQDRHAGSSSIGGGRRGATRAGARAATRPSGRRPRSTPIRACQPRSRSRLLDAGPAPDDVDLEASAGARARTRLGPAAGLPDDAGDLGDRQLVARRRR